METWAKIRQLLLSLLQQFELQPTGQTTSNSPGFHWQAATLMSLFDAKNRSIAVRIRQP